MKTIWQTPDGRPPSKLPPAPAPGVVPKLKAPVRRGPYRNSAKILAEMLAFLRGGSKLRKELIARLEVDDATLRRTLEVAVKHQLVTTTVDMTQGNSGPKPMRVALVVPGVRDE